MLRFRFAPVGLALGAVFFAAMPAVAQVTYAPHVYYGYPVPGGVLQPDETLSTSLGFAILPTPYGYPPAVAVTERCLYPDGWNSTDFDRDVNGIPASIDHTCPSRPYERHAVRTRY